MRSVFSASSVDLHSVAPSALGSHLETAQLPPFRGALSIDASDHTVSLTAQLDTHTTLPRPPHTCPSHDSAALQILQLSSTSSCRYKRSIQLLHELVPTIFKGAASLVDWCKQICDALE